MEKRNIDDLLKKTYRFFSDRIEPEKIRKIIPIAFPVLQSTWKTKIAMTESFGLIDRYILRVLKEFGPCDVKRIDEFLCLGEDRIEHALIEMEKLGSPITRCAKGYSFAADGDIEHFHVEQEHDFTFCVNGITGELLPVDFCRKSKRAEINDDGEGHPLYVKLSSIISGSESELSSLRSGMDAKRFDEGVPDGFVCLAGEKPLGECCRYFLSFAIVTLDGAMTVFCAGDNSLTLNSSGDYLKRLPGIESLLAKKDVIDMQLPGLSLKQEGTAICVKVLDQALWDCSSGEESSNQSIFFVRDFIKKGWRWDISNRKFSHYRLLPADAETAIKLFICRASFELGHACADLDTRADAENWLREYFENFDNHMIECPSLDDILKPLLKSHNSEVRDFARMVSARGEKQVVPQKLDKSFCSSTEKEWPGCIIDWIRKAVSSVQIISPVIDSELIFHELQEANQRGVYLQIITSLLDREGKIKASGDKQFSSLQIPGRKLAALGASVRATKYVPHAKIIIIDESIVLFMSANLSDNSLGFGKVNAVETCILLHEPSIVSSFLRLFTGIWESAQFIQGTNQDSAFIAQKAGKSLSAVPDLLKGKDENLIFSCPQNLALEKAIVNMVKNAESEVLLMAMSFYDMEQVPELYEVLFELLSRNVSVKLLVRTGHEQFAPSAWPDESTKRLLSAGMQLVEIPHLHAKGVIVDDTAVLAMSANLNPYSLGNTPTSHIECGLSALAGASWAQKFIAFSKGLLRPGCGREM